MAAEPLVAAPVAFDWGPDGKLWVAEMIDYPLGLDNQGQPGGRICYLEDTDGDGRFDRRTLFLDGVAFPNGVMAWRDGVLVTAAGEVFFARDTDGDGKADERKTLFAGFNPGNQQHRVNGLRWGMDGWFYLANGDSGGVIESRQTGRRVDISGRDLRDSTRRRLARNRDRHDAVRPRPRRLGPLVRLEQLESRLSIRARRSLPAPQSARRTACPEIGQSSTLAMLLHPLSVTIHRLNDPQPANHYTSACGATIYRDDLLGARVAGNYFVCEPSHNLVHREIAHAETGWSITASRPTEPNRIFCARPTTGFGRSCAGPAPTGACGWPTSTAACSNIRSTFPTTS